MDGIHVSWSAFLGGVVVVLSWWWCCSGCVGAVNCLVERLKSISSRNIQWERSDGLDLKFCGSF